MEGYNEHNGVDVPKHSALLASLDARVGTLEEARSSDIIVDRDSSDRLHELERKVDVMSERMGRYEGEFSGIRHDLSLITDKQDLLKERTPSRDEWNELKKAVTALKDKPMNTWNKIKTIALTIAASGFIYYVLAQLLPTVFSKITP